MTFFKHTLNISMKEWKHSEMVVEE